MDYQAVLFDFDYTLGDATPSIYEGFLYGFEKMGYPSPSLEAVRQTIGLMLEDAFTSLTGEASPDKRNAFRRFFHDKVGNSQAEKTTLFPGAAELICALCDEGVQVGVVSSKRSTTLRQILSRFGLLERMGYVTGGELVRRPKPDPEGLNAGITALDVPKKAVLYCGDTVIDAETAQNAGVDFAAVLNGTTPVEAFAPYPHVYAAKDLPSLARWLGLNI